MSKSKFLGWVQSLSYLEWIIIFLFLVFIVFPLPLNHTVALFFDSSLGMVLLFFATLYFFLGTHPAVGVLFVFFAYELLRRSHAVTQQVPLLRAEGMNFPSVQREPMQQPPEESLIKEGNQPILTQDERDARMASFNPQIQHTLEEEIVAAYGPTRTGAIYEPPTFNPITSSKIHASVF
jgi:hypothetical protein